MILFLGAGVIVSYALVYSGISTLQLGKDKGVTTLQALWPKGMTGGPGGGSAPSTIVAPNPATGNPGSGSQGSSGYVHGGRT